MHGGMLAKVKRSEMKAESARLLQQWAKYNLRQPLTVIAGKTISNQFEIGNEFGCRPISPFLVCGGVL